MKKHNGMRPLDIVVLLKISTLSSNNRQVIELSRALNISQSEISESLHRSAFSGLLSSDKKVLMKTALLEFLEFGLKYVFPQQPGGIVKGIPTAHSAPPLNEQVNSNEAYVWPYAFGVTRGQMIEPLYKTVPEISLKDAKLYELLSLTDALRIGRVRDQKIAIEELRRRINGNNL